MLRWVVAMGSVGCAACSSTPGAGSGPSPSSPHEGCTPGEQVWQLGSDNSFADLDFSPDATVLHVRSAEGAWNIEVADGVMPNQGDARAAGMAFAFAPDGELVAGTGNYNQFDAELRLARPAPVLLNDARVEELPGVPGAARSLAWSWDGDRLIGTGDTGAIAVYDMEERTQIQAIDGFYPGFGTKVSITKSGSIGMVMGQAEVAITFDTSSGEALATYGGHITGTWVHGGELARDGSVAVTAATDRSVHTWDTRTGERRGGQDALPSPQRDATITPSGDVYLTGGDDGVIRAYRTDDDSELSTFTGTMPIFRIVASPDDNLFATAEYPQDRSAPAILRVWCLGDR